MIFSDNPCLERQRDFFIFQSLIGCRIENLYGFTKANIVNGAIDFVRILPKTYLFFGLSFISYKVKKYIITKKRRKL